MKIIYQDEYGEDLFTDNNGLIPPKESAVTINEEDYRISGYHIFPEQGIVIVSVTQNLLRSSEKSENESRGRLKEMQSAIIGVSNRLEATEKKQRNLSEQVTTVRKHINQSIRQGNKERPES